MKDTDKYLITPEEPGKRERNLFEHAIFGVEPLPEETIKRIGSISTGFTETTAAAVFQEATELSNIREVTVVNIL